MALSKTEYNRIFLEKKKRREEKLEEYIPQIEQKIDEILSSGRNVIYFNEIFFNGGGVISENPTYYLDRLKRIYVDWSVGFSYNTDFKFPSSILSIPTGFKFL